MLETIEADIEVSHFEQFDAKFIAFADKTRTRRFNFETGEYTELRFIAEGHRQDKTAITVEFKVVVGKEELRWFKSEGEVQVSLSPSVFEHFYDTAKWRLMWNSAGKPEIPFSGTLIFKED